MGAKCLQTRLWQGLLLTLVFPGYGHGHGDLGFAKLYLIRHGQSTANVWPHRWLFKKDVLLTQVGQDQAARTAHCLAKHGATPPDLVLSSCLVRAQETALLAFPKGNVTVHVAPHINEISLLRFSFSNVLPENIPTGKDDQLADVTRAISPQAAMRDSFDWVSAWTENNEWPAACGPPDWSRFLEWLARRPEVRQLIQERLKRGEVPHIAVASHYMFMMHVLKQHGWHDGKLHNAETVEAKIPLLGDADGSFTQFGTFYDATELCSGGAAAFNPEPCIYMFIVALLSFACYYRCRGASARSAKVDASYVLHEPLASSGAS